MSTPPTTVPVGDAARRVLARADALAELSAAPDRLQRHYLTPEHAAVHRLLGGWMHDAGLRPRPDAAGNLLARRTVDRDDQPALLLGSHQDTVSDAGRFDGTLGILVAIEVAERLASTGLPFALEAIAFGGKEGGRFGRTLLGSRAVAGEWNPAWLDLVDAGGTTLRQAALDFGLDPDRMGEAARRPEELAGFLEVHIEQGPRLERQGRAVGVVTRIAAVERRVIRLVGEARHAGTPRTQRRDALLGAAEAILAIERIARAQHSTATVGQIRVEPSTVTAVPGVAEFSLDLRDTTTATRDEVWRLILQDLQGIALDRRLALETTVTHRRAEVTADPGIRSAIEAGIRRVEEGEPMDLVSITGHDAVALAAITGAGMLFVRCADGRSHHPDESVDVDDVARAIEVLEETVRELARSARPAADGAALG